MNGGGNPVKALLIKTPKAKNKTRDRNRGARHITPNPSVEDAAAAVRAGGVVACPTEAVFGLSCDPTNAKAVARVLALKHRPADRGLILIAADFSQLERFCAPLDEARQREVRATWPGPHTWLFPASAACPPQVRGAHPTVAVRVTAHPIAAQLCRLSGTALVSTSATLRGPPPARTAPQVAAIFGNTRDAIIEGDTSGNKSVTPIKNANTGESVRASE